MLSLRDRQVPQAPAAVAGFQLAGTEGRGFGQVSVAARTDDADRTGLPAVATPEDTRPTNGVLRARERIDVQDPIRYGDTSGLERAPAPVLNTLAE